MRIVHVIDYFQPKLGYQETFLAKEHATMGHDVYVVTSDRYSPFIYHANKDLLGRRMVGCGFFIEEGIKVWRLRALFEIPHAIWVRSIENKIRELKPDIVIIHGIVSFSALRIARLKKKLGNFKLLYDDHMTFGLSLSKMKILYPFFKWMFSGLIQAAADALVAILPETKRLIHKRYGVPPERIAVIPLGADEELFRFDASARKEMRDSLSIGESDTVFIYTGKVIHIKRLHILIEAAAKLTANNASVKVMLVGSGALSYIEELKQSIKTKGLEGKFIWHDAVPNEQLHRSYSAADAAVWPYGPSISMREAMACGLPIIIGENSTVTELVAYGNGLLYREEDVPDLAQQMEKLLDPELRREMGAKSRKLVEDRFTWRRIAEQFIELAQGSKHEF